MLDVYAKALDNAGRLIAGTKPDQYGKPAPALHDAKGVINHLIGGCYFMSMVSAGQEIDMTAPRPDFTTDDPTAAFDGAKKLALDAFSGSDAMTKTWKFPFGELPGTKAIGVAVIEAVAHGWDLAKATGQDHGIDPQLATVLLEGAKQGIPDELRSPEGDPFAKIVPVPDNASPVDKLVAFLGRRP